MTTSQLRLWLGFGVLSTLMVAGCQSRRCCCCPCDCRVVCCESAPAVLTPTPAPVATLPGFDDSKATAKPEPPAAKPEPRSTISMTAVAPHDSGAPSDAGTILLTPVEADSMGVKPGYTPDALYMPEGSTKLPEGQKAAATAEPY